MNISQEYIPDHSYTTYTDLYLGLGMAHEHDTISFIVLIALRTDDAVY